MDVFCRAAQWTAAASLWSRSSHLCTEQTKERAFLRVFPYLYVYIVSIWACMIIRYESNCFVTFESHGFNFLSLTFTLEHSELLFCCRFNIHSYFCFFFYTFRVSVSISLPHPATVAAQQSLNWSKLPRVSLWQGIDQQKVREVGGERESRKDKAGGGVPGAHPSPPSFLASEQQRARQDATDGGTVMSAPSDRSFQPGRGTKTGTNRTSVQPAGSST